MKAMVPAPRFYDLISDYNMPVEDVLPTSVCSVTLSRSRQQTSSKHTARPILCRIWHPLNVTGKYQ